MSHNDFLNKKIQRPKEKKPGPKVVSLKTLEIKELKMIHPIGAYKEKKMKKWDEIYKEDLNLNTLKEFVIETYDIHNDSNKL